MTTTPRASVARSDVEPKPEGASPADRGAEILARRIEDARRWGSDPQHVLAGVLADLIALAEEDRDLSFGDALAEAWRLDEGGRPRLAG